MRTFFRLARFLALIYCLVVCTSVVVDKVNMENSMIRLHVVANSDTPEDQAVKLQVKDAIVSYLQPIMKNFTSKEEAAEYIQTHMKELEQVANHALKELGESVTAIVTFTKEKFDIREYETFSLPSGMYDALRIQIGEGEGKNWWCVAFPTLCMPATTEEFADTAVSSGFSDTLTRTIAKDEEYQIRFFFLDLLGRVENLLH